MAFRGFNMALPGSLLKGEKAKGKSKSATLGRNPRVNDPKHLAFIRTLECLSCGADPAGEAAHLRASSLKHGKPNAGAGAKPDDRWVLPLCHECHVNGPKAQHRVGERPFWDKLGINPFMVCEELFAASGNRDAAGLITIHARGGAFPPEWD